MVAMGFFGNKEDLGLEGSGVILRVGADVKEFSVGERVVLMHPGTLCSRLVVPEGACIKLPGKLSMADAATMLATYVTVLYSLLEVGLLKKDQVCWVMIRSLMFMVDKRPVSSHPLGMWGSWTCRYPSLPGCWRSGELAFCLSFMKSQLTFYMRFTPLSEMKQK